MVFNGAPTDSFLYIDVVSSEMIGKTGVPEENQPLSSILTNFLTLGSSLSVI